MKALILGGEELDSALCRETLANFGDQIAIHNEYGPTEATVGCCDYVFRPDESGRAVSIGRTIANANVLIKQGAELCGIGVPGEICIVGDGVAQGYLNRPDLNAEKFGRDPFTGRRSYRSGDLGRRLPDGRIEYWGRVDDYVAPRDDVEKALADVFGEILRKERIGVDDNFLLLGGDSIKAIRICAKLRERGYQTNVKAITLGKTIANVAKETVAATRTVLAEQGEIVGEVPLTAIQNDFANANLPRPEHFNQSVLLEIFENVEISQLDAAFTALTPRRDMLRATFARGRQYVNPVAGKKTFDLREIVLDDENDETLKSTLNGVCDELQRGFDLERGPLTKVAFELSAADTKASFTRRRARSTRKLTTFFAPRRPERSAI